jgi:signal transduction histidine kinase
MGGVRPPLRVEQRILLLALLCVMLSGVSSVYFVRSLLKPDTGLLGYYPEVEARGTSLVYSPSAPFSPAMASGLLPERDSMLFVNGVRVTSSRDLVRVVSAVTRFEPFPVIVQRDAGAVLTLALTPAFVPTRIDWIFVVIFCLALTTAAFTLSWHLPQQPGILALVLAALLSLLFTCVKPFAYEGVLSNLLFNMGNIGAWLLAVFAMFFPWERGSRTIRLCVILLILALYAVFCALRVGLYIHWMSTGLEHWLALYKRVGQIGNISDGVAYVVLALLLSSAYSRVTLSRDKTLLQWILAGILLSLPPYFFLDQLPLILGGPAVRVGLGAFAQLFLSVLPLFLLIGLSRQRPFNFRFFLARYALYGALFLVMVALFALLYLPLKATLEKGYAVDSPLPELFAAGVILLALALLRLPVEWVLVHRVWSASRTLPGRSREANAPPAGSVDREDVHSRQAQNLADLRAIMHGVARILKAPVRQLTKDLPRTGDSAQQEASARVSEFLRTLESFAGAGVTIRGSETAESIARQAVARVVPRFPGVRFEVTGGSSDRLSCYPEEIVQALSCILDNAAEAQGTQTHAILVSAWSDTARALIEVVDGGTGIDARAVRKLFTPFFTTKPGHHGLGLYLARALVERSNGTIEVRPGDDGGTAVRVSLPGGPPTPRRETPWANA